MLKTVSTLGNFANVVKLTSTDPGAAASPVLDLYRDSVSPAAADTLGEIEFNGEDSAGNKQQYAVIHGSIISPTSGAEGGQLHFETTTAGASTEKMTIGTTNLVINEIGAIYNVRIEGDTDANLLYTDATNSRVGIGTISPAEKLDVVGNIKLSGNVIPASGFGIDFAATPGTAGMTSELLNDYEEGSWTPAVAGSTLAGTYELQSSSATYTKIGRQVTLICFVRLAAVITGLGTGALTITGLPFAKTIGHYPIGQVLFDGVDWTAGANLCSSFGTVGVGSTIFFEQTNDNAGSSSVQITGVAANDYIFFTISYWA